MTSTREQRTRRLRVPPTGYARSLAEKKARKSAVDWQLAVLRTLPGSKERVALERAARESQIEHDLLVYSIPPTSAARDAVERKRRIPFPSRRSRGPVLQAQPCVACGGARGSSVTRGMCHACVQRRIERTRGRVEGFATRTPGGNVAFRREYR